MGRWKWSMWGNERRCAADHRPLLILWCGFMTSQEMQGLLGYHLSSLSSFASICACIFEHLSVLSALLLSSYLWCESMHFSFQRLQAKRKCRCHSKDKPGPIGDFPWGCWLQICQCARRLKLKNRLKVFPWALIWAIYTRFWQLLPSAKWCTPNIFKW